MDSSVSPKDEIWVSARVPSHFNWPLPCTIGSRDNSVSLVSTGWTKLGLLPIRKAIFLFPTSSYSDLYTIRTGGGGGQPCLLTCYGQHSLPSPVEGTNKRNFVFSPRSSPAGKFQYICCSVTVYTDSLHVITLLLFGLENQ